MARSTREVEAMAVKGKTTCILLAAACSLGIAGCATSSDCEDTASCTHGAGGAAGRDAAPQGAGGARDGSAETGVGGSSGAAGAGGTQDDGAADGGSDGSGDARGTCDLAKRPSEDPCVVDDANGVFVSPAGDDTGAGTKAAPLKTIGQALTRAKGAQNRLFVCA